MDRIVLRAINGGEVERVAVKGISSHLLSAIQTKVAGFTEEPSSQIQDLDRALRDFTRVPEETKFLAKQLIKGVNGAEELEARTQAPRAYVPTPTPQECGL